jgi:hypothetical protein
MSVWDFDGLAPVLHAVGMAAAKDEPLDVDSLAAELGGRRTDVGRTSDGRRTDVGRTSRCWSIRSTGRDSSSRCGKNPSSHRP